MDGSLIRGIAWTGGAKWTVQLLSWAVTLIVARLLAPEDYGLMGMAAVYLALVRLVTEFGLGASIVILRTLTREQTAQLNSVAVLFGLAVFGVSCLLADPIARFFEAPEVQQIILVMSAGFVIGAFRTVPYALLERDLRFKHLALIEGSQAIAGSAATLLLAYLGFGYWALVGGALVNSVASTGLALLVRPYPFALPRRVGFALRISSHILTSRLSWFVFSNADSLIAGKLLGQTALGFYSIALTLASMPVDRITAMVSRVLPAVFSAVQTDTAALRRYFLNVTEGLALLTFPVAWGLALVAGEFVPLVLGSKWQGAVLPLQILAFYSAFRCIAPLKAHVFNVTGQTRFAMHMGVVSAIVLPAGFLFGSRFGIEGIAAAWLVLHPLINVVAYWRVFRTLEMGTGAYLRALWPALSAALPMTATVWGLKQTVLVGWHTGAVLGIEVISGAMVYGLFLLVFQRSRLQAALDLIKMLRE